MSRVIANDHLWDKFEVEYQLARNRFKEVEKNRQQWEGVAGLPEDSKPVGLELDPQVFEFVKNLDPEQLKEALEKREMSTEGSTKELKMALAQRIQADKNAAHSE